MKSRRLMQPSPKPQDQAKSNLNDTTSLMAGVLNWLIAKSQRHATALLRIDIENPSRSLPSRKVGFEAPYTTNRYYRMDFRRDVVIGNFFLTDVVTKTAYSFLAIAAILFVTMLLLTSIHP
jgi:hypothetical protein